MGKKIFVSYKHDDDNVEPLWHSLFWTTARTYVDEIEDQIEAGDDIYKGEGRDEDMSHCSEGAIEEHLKKKMHDSSVTIVLISPGMKEKGSEREQWIPWEISYSLKEIARGGRASLPNAMLAVVLPDFGGSYDYVFEDSRRFPATKVFFKILLNNMNNLIKPGHPSDLAKEPSYIMPVKWEDFIKRKDYYIGRAFVRFHFRQFYNLTKEISND